MSNKLNMSLDDIISTRSRPGERRRESGSGRGWMRGRVRTRSSEQFDRNRPASRIPDGAWTHDRFNEGDGEHRRRESLNATVRLVISNLDSGVSDSDIKELFGEFGPIRRCFMQYDKAGRSEGTAEVIYERRADASRAMRQYNDVALDGREMKIHIAPDTTPSESRLGPMRRSGESGRGGGGRGYSGGFRGFRDDMRGNRDGGSGFRDGGRRGVRDNGRGRVRGRRDAGPQKTAEELDAELDAYVKRA